MYCRSIFFKLVVAQTYEVEADNEYVIRGNAAVMKCEVPSFVSDFVTVENWRDSQGNVYLPGENNYGTNLENIFNQFLDIHTLKNVYRDRPGNCHSKLCGNIILGQTIEQKRVIL